MRHGLFFVLSIVVLSSLAGAFLPRCALGADAVVTGTVTADRLNLRDGPGTTYAVVGNAPRGARLTILESGAEWHRVRTDDGTEGWAAARFVTLDAPPSPEAEARDTGETPATGTIGRDRDTEGSGGGSKIGAVLKWGCLAGAAVFGGLAYSEHQSGNDAYDDYTAHQPAVDRREITPDDVEYLRQDAIDHDDKAMLYAGVAGGLAALFLVQQFILGGDDDHADALFTPRTDGPVALSLGGDHVRAGLVLARF